jgi:transposase
MLSLHEEAQAPGKDGACLLEEEAVPLKPRPKRESRERVPSHLPVVEEVLEPEEVAADPGQWRRIGEERTELLDCEPARYIRRVLIRPKYVSRVDKDTAPVIAPLPALPQERCIAAPGLLASIAVAKYCDHLPLYRQESILRTRHGITLPRSTLARWMELVAFWLEPVYRHLRGEILQSGYIQVDERSCGSGDHRLPQAARRVRRPGGRSIKRQSSILIRETEKPAKATFGRPTRQEATRSSSGKQAALPPAWKTSSRSTSRASCNATPTRPIPASRASTKPSRWPGAGPMRGGTSTTPASTRPCTVIGSCGKSAISTPSKGSCANAGPAPICGKPCAPRKPARS